MSVLLQTLTRDIQKWKFRPLRGGTDWNVCPTTQTMRIAQVIGKVTLLRGHPSLRGASFKIVVPLTREGILGDEAGRSEPVVMFDSLGAGEGSLVAMSESAEAANPFHPDTKPIDAYNAAILDSIDLPEEDRS